MNEDSNRESQTANRSHESLVSAFVYEAAIGLTLATWLGFTIGAGLAMAGQPLGCIRRVVPLWSVPIMAVVALPLQAVKLGHSAYGGADGGWCDSQ